MAVLSGELIEAFLGVIETLIFEEPFLYLETSINFTGQAAPLGKWHFLIVGFAGLS